MTDTLSPATPSKNEDGFVAHTPGPWRYEYDDNGFYCVTAHAAPSPYIVATGGEGDTDKANARLIAAAPDLLGAIKFMLAFYEPGQTYLDTEAWKQAEASARRAVAKATGVSP